jgi:hypothetical protein
MKPIKQMIEEADSDIEIRLFLTYGNLTRPSGRIRRSWLTAARIRREQIKEDISKGITLIQ